MRPAGVKLLTRLSVGQTTGRRFIDDDFLFLSGHGQRLARSRLRSSASVVKFWLNLLLPNVSVAGLFLRFMATLVPSLTELWGKKFLVLFVVMTLMIFVTPFSV